MNSLPVDKIVPPHFDKASRVRIEITIIYIISIKMIDIR